MDDLEPILRPKLEPILLRKEDFKDIKDPMDLPKGFDNRDLHVELAWAGFWYRNNFFKANYEPKYSESIKCIEKAVKCLKKAKEHLESAHSYRIVMDIEPDPDEPGLYPSGPFMYESKSLQRIEDVIEKEINIIERGLKNKKTKKGRPQKKHLDTLIWKLADIYEKFTGKKAKSIKDTNAPTVKSPPPFQVFAKVCFEKFDVHELVTNETIDQNIFNALKARRGKK